MKITLVISSLDAGGAERVLTGMANWWSKKGHQVMIITLSDTPSFYQLEDNIDRIKLNLLFRSNGFYQAVKNIFLRIFALRAAVKQSNPDVVVSFLDKTNILVLIACLGLGCKIIISERTNPLYLPIGKVWSRLRKLTYNRATKLIVQTQSIVTWGATQVDAAKVFVIPNAIDEERLFQIQHASAIAVEITWKYRIITMGRLSHEKGHDLLLKSFAQLMAQYPDWGLEIVGEGALKDSLILLAHELGVSHRVKFYGQIQQPFGYIKGADIFVLPSRVEGFPNVLLEAMAIGKAVVSFNCPSGPADLIQHGVNGLLVDSGNVDAMAAAISELIISPEKRKRFGLSAQSVKSVYSEQNIMNLWDRVIQS